MIVNQYSRNMKFLLVDFFSSLGKQENNEYMKYTNNNIFFNSKLISKLFWRKKKHYLHRLMLGAACKLHNALREEWCLDFVTKCYMAVFLWTKILIESFLSQVMVSILIFKNTVKNQEKLIKKLDIELVAIVAILIFFI